MGRWTCRGCGTMPFLVRGEYRKYNKENKMSKVWDFLPELLDALRAQLESDDKRWGDTWLKRTREGQEERTIKSFNDKFDQYLHAKSPIPWLKMIGDCFICWIREQHPEMWQK
jgi:hypothetical protein